MEPMEGSNLMSSISLFAKRVLYYIKIWFMMSKNSLLGILVQRKILAIFLLGKILKSIFFTIFIYFLVTSTGGLLNYSPNQVIFFFFTFSSIDATAQFFFREVYRFRPLVVSGDFDLILLKPFSGLFRVLLGGADFMDLVTLPFLYFATYYFGRLLNPTPTEILIYIALVMSSLVLASALHIIVLAFGIISLEVDHIVMIYRDFTSMGRFPVDIYKQPLKELLTYFVPVGIMMTTPAKALMGLLDIKGIVFAFAASAFFFVASLKFWNFALKRYTSASS